MKNGIIFGLALVGLLWLMQGEFGDAPGEERVTVHYYHADWSPACAETAKLYKALQEIYRGGPVDFVLHDFSTNRNVEERPVAGLGLDYIELHKRLGVLDGDGVGTLPGLSTFIIAQSDYKILGRLAHKAGATQTNIEQIIDDHFGF